MSCLTKIPLVAVLLVAVLSAAGHASPVMYCRSDAHGDFIRGDRHLNGLRTYIAVQDAWDGVPSPKDTLHLAHCPSNKAVKINATEASPNLSHARIVLLGMMANDKRESLQDVVDRMQWQDYLAEITQLPDDGCMCTEDF